MPPVILGINCSGFHSSACLLGPDGAVLVAIAEERLSRVKQDKSFPRRAIRYCCETAGISLADVTDVFIGWNPAPYLSQPTLAVGAAFQDRGQLAQLTLNELAALSGGVAGISQSLHSFAGPETRLHYVNHHHAHLANALLPSGFEAADFLIADGFGETTTGLLGTATPAGLTELAANRTPHSLGLFYSAFTEFVGFQPNGDEWKMMALAARGNWRTVLRPAAPAAHGTGPALRSRPAATSSSFSALHAALLFAQAGGAAGPGAAPPHAELTQREYDIVAAVQRLVEEAVFELLANLHAQTGQHPPRARRRRVYELRAQWQSCASARRTRKSSSAAPPTTPASAWAAPCTDGARCWASRRWPATPSRHNFFRPRIPGRRPGSRAAAAQAALRAAGVTCRPPPPRLLQQGWCWAGFRGRRSLGSGRWATAAFWPTPRAPT